MPSRTRLWQRIGREGQRPVSPDYWACVITKNGGPFIGRTLSSIIHQTRPPTLIVVVDDGSTDTTPRVLTDLAKQLDNTLSQLRLHVLSLPDKGYDIRRVPVNLNAAYTHVEENEEGFTYSMISGDDSAYPSDYSSALLSEMDSDPELLVASGDCETPARLFETKAPQGSGRFIRTSFWEKVGARYPESYGWESWLLFKAMQAGGRILNFGKMRYQHLRPTGSMHKFTHWGLEMRALGYHPLTVLKRFANDSLGRAAEPVSMKGSLSMTAAYFLAPFHDDPFFHPFDPTLRGFVRKLQLQGFLRMVPAQLRNPASAFWTITGRLADP